MDTEDEADDDDIEDEDVNCISSFQKKNETSYASTTSRDLFLRKTSGYISKILLKLRWILHADCIFC